MGKIKDKGGHDGRGGRDRESDAGAGVASLTPKGKLIPAHSATMATAMAVIDNAG